MSTPRQPAPSRLYTNAALTVIAGLLAVVAFDPRSGPGGLISQASAGQTHAGPPTGARTGSGGDEGEDTSRVSAAEQRKVIIAELRGLSTRMEHLEATLNKGISVKVTDMPAIQFPTEKTEKKEEHKAEPDHKAADKK